MTQNKELEMNQIQNGSGGAGTPIVPPFDMEKALAKVRAAEDAWNSRDPQRVALAYSSDSEWRNRTRFVRGRDQIRAFLEHKWSRELDYRLCKALWGFRENRMAVRFQYEWHNAEGQWFRSYGNELWEFDEAGLMRRREASINDLAITESERRFFWDAPGPRPIEHEGIPLVQ
jgi:nuclear transport factor 2 (NTF2) superfamily protein